jgi:hypothetical protein
MSHGRSEKALSAHQHIATMVTYLDYTTLVSVFLLAVQPGAFRRENGSILVIQMSGGLSIGVISQRTAERRHICSATWWDDIGWVFLWRNQTERGFCPPWLSWSKAALGILQKCYVANHEDPGNLKQREILAQNCNTSWEFESCFRIECQVSLWLLVNIEFSSANRLSSSCEPHRISGRTRIRFKVSWIKTHRINGMGSLNTICEVNYGAVFLSANQYLLFLHSEA